MPTSVGNDAQQEIVDANPRRRLEHCTVVRVRSVRGRAVNGAACKTGRIDHSGTGAPFHRCG